MVFDVDKRLKVICSLVMLAAIVFMPLAGMSDLQAQEDDTFHLGPLNPDFVKFFEERPGPFYGYIPPPMDLSHLDEIPVERSQEATSLPGSFDWRDTGKVTSVKNQNPCGTCWVHGTLAAVESRVLIQESTEYDFSEQNLACCTDSAWVYLIGNRCNGGGWSWLAADTLTKKGSRLEACQPYNTSTINAEACDDSCQSVKMVTDFRMIADPATSADVIEPIKDAIYNHGPLAMSYHADADDAHLYSGSIYYWPGCTQPANHLVCLIGWDDDIVWPGSAGTGAWIAKNSWGTGWGDNGYFYLCYGSASMCEVASLDYKDYDANETLYYWDEAGQVSGAGCSGPSAWMANIFTSAQDGNLTHVDFWTTSNNAQYDIYVYLDGDISDGLQNQAAFKSGTCEEYGYYSIQLSSPVSLTNGQSFIIAVKMTTPSYNYPLPVECQYGGGTTADPTIQSGVSYARCGDTGAWDDVAPSGWNVCLRGRVTSEAAGQPDITVSPISFDETLPPDTTQDYTLTIGNAGDAALTYDISDRGTTGQGAPSGVQLPTSQFVEREGLIELSPSEPMSFATPLTTGTEIAYDDGEAESAYYWDFANCGFAVRFTPPQYPVDLTVARICFWPGWPDSDHEEFDVEVYDDDGTDGSPGTLLGGGTTMASDWGWCDVDISALGITITSGDFYVLYKQLTNAPDCEALCVDENNPAGRSWDYFYIWYEGWEPWEEVNNMIRCVVEAGGAAEGCSWLDENPTSGSVQPGNSATITVTIDTTGLAEGDYSAEIVIASNDPDEDPKIVPVTLHVDQPGTQPDITVSPTSFDETLASDTTQDYTLTIGNAGDVALTYDISDREATGGGSGLAPTGTSPPPPSAQGNSDADNVHPVEEPDIRPSAQEEHAPHQIFEEGDTLAELRDKIEQNGYNFMVDYNWVYDMSPEEKGNFFGRGDRGFFEGIGDSEDIGPLASHLGRKQLPSQFDWRNHNGHSYIGDIGNQGSCGSCYAFGACAAAEGTYNLAMGLYDENCSDFSESFVIWCLGSLPAYNLHFYGCDGADYTYSELTALTVEGVSSEADFPYQTSDGCGDHWDDPLITFDSWHRIPCGDIDAIKTAIMTYGPVDAAVYVTAAFEAYSGGIYEDTNTDCPESPCYNTYTNHAIALVGWDDNGDPDTNGYWILRNSWGADDWGENGYMRIKYRSAAVACAACYLVYSGGGDCPWLSVSPTSGSVQPGNSATITVTIDTTGLAEGDYSAEIVIASNDPDENPLTVPVTLHVGEWDPGIYDGDGDGVIQKMEALEAIQDYFDGEITKMQMLEVLQLYFTG